MTSVNTSLISNSGMTGNNPYLAPQHHSAHASKKLRNAILLLLRSVVLFAAVPASGFLLLDGLVYRNPATDPVTGKQYGCFTMVEGMLGLQDRAGILRPVELLLGVALFPTVCFVCCRFWRAGSHAKSTNSCPASSSEHVDSCS